MPMSSSSSSKPAGTFSFSAQCFSKEDERKELSELTEAEKEAILDDKYGRNATATINNSDHEENQEHNEDNDIPDELLDEFFRARDSLLPDQSEELWYAVFEDEDVVAIESNPARFLRCENYDPKRAALRQGEYWKLRYEIFGEDDAVKPLTLNCAMKDVVPQMVKIPNFVRILPDDDRGRTVVCVDKTEVRLKDYDCQVLLKILWFVLHKALEKKSTQQNGIVLIIINQSMSWDFPPIRLLKYFNKTVNNTIPITIRCSHGCMSSLVVSLVMPIVKYITTRHARLRVQIHNCLDKPKLLADLEGFGIPRKKLPKSIGGYYDVKPSWIVECEEILKQRKAMAYRDKRQRI